MTAPVAVGLWLDRAVHAADDHSMRRTTAQRSASADRDFAALVLRLAIGPMLIAHGSNKVMGSGGLDGTTGWFESLGLRPAAVHARVAAATEITAGTAITLGSSTRFPRPPSSA